MSAPYRETVDIEDSIVTINKYSFIGTDFVTSLFDSVTRQITLPTHCGCGGSILPLEKTFEIKGDTVVYSDADSLLSKCYSFTPMKLFRSNLQFCRWQHVTENYGDILELTKFKRATSKIIDYDSLKRTSAIAAIIIGYEKGRSIHDSIKLAVADVFIEFDDIPRYLNEVSFPNVPIAVCIIASEDVPQTYLDKVVTTIAKDTIKVNQFHLVTYDNETKLGYQIARLKKK